MRRSSPITIGIVLGLLFGAAGVAGIAAADKNDTGKKVFVAEPVFDPEAGTVGAATAAVVANVQGDLPPLQGEARAYRLGTEPANGAVERLAAAFDIHGPVQRDGGGWVVREGPKLVRVQDADGLPWFFTALEGPCKLVPGTPAPGTPTSEALQGVPPSGPTDCPDQPAPQPAERPPDLPTRDEALGSGMERLGRAGLGVSKPRIFDEGNDWRIETSPLVGDKPTVRFPWTITVGSNGAPTAASGFLAKPESAESYDLIGTKAALERMPAAVPADRGVPTVTAVHLGLMLGRVQGEDDSGDNPTVLAPAPTGRPYLVPAYLFELERQSPRDPQDQPPPVIAVPAVADRYLAPPG